MINLPSGQEDFKQLRENGSTLYIDKTYFIKEWWESDDKITLILRPRCFGKTLNMSMVNYFFSNRYENSQSLFSNLFISNENELMNHQGQYPVISLNFNDLKYGDIEFVKSQVKMKIWETYVFFKSQLLESNLLDMTEKSFINSITYEMTDDFAIHSIQYLCCFLNKVYNNKGTIVLLDEYDALIMENWNFNGMNNSFISDEVRNFYFNFISSSFKENKFLMRGIITGVTNIALYAKNIGVYSMISPKYSSCFGFTKEEVFELSKLFQLNSKIDEIEWWYGGYFNNYVNILNPYSVVHFLSDPSQFSNFWFTSSSHIFLNQIIKDGFLSVKDCIINLIQGRSIQKELDNKIVLHDYNDKSEETIWILLLSAGYLTIEKIEDSKFCSKKKFTLRLTNNEVRASFLILLDEIFDDLRCILNEFINSLFEMNFCKMEQFLNEFFEKSLNFCDQSQIYPESIYHTFILGLVVNLRNSFYITLKNLNFNGECFYVVLKPMNVEGEKTFYIFLFKKHFTEIIRRTFKEIFTDIWKQEISNDYPDLLLENIKKIVFDYNEQGCNIYFETLEQQQQQQQQNENQNNNNNSLNIINNTKPTHNYNIRPRNNTNYNNENTNDEKEEEEDDNEDDFEDESDDKDKSFKPHSSGNTLKSRKDQFDHRKYTHFHVNDEVYVIDKNGYDLWEAVIVKNNSGAFFGIHYPNFPQEDETIKGGSRILRRTPKNIKIYKKQEEMRNKALEENGDKLASPIKPSDKNNKHINDQNNSNSVDNTNLISTDG